MESWISNGKSDEGLVYICFYGKLKNEKMNKKMIKGFDHKNLLFFINIVQKSFHYKMKSFIGYNP